MLVMWGSCPVGLTEGARGRGWESWWMRWEGDSGDLLQTARLSHRLEGNIVVLEP